MLAAMATPPTPAAHARQVAPTCDRTTGRARQRDDACPGALRLHAADDGALARVRIPGGVLDSGQARALADLAQRLGDGALHLTSRGNVQFRGLPADCGADLADALTTARLLPSAAHERVRNIVASPLSGLDGHGHRDIRPWLTELDRLLCADDAVRALSGRFLFALDDGRGDVAALGADVTLLASVPGAGPPGAGSGTRTAPGTPDVGLLRCGDAPHAVSVAAPDAPRAALLAATAFLEAAHEHGIRAWRVRDLPEGAREFTRRVVRRLTGAGLPVRADDVPVALPVGSAHPDAAAPGTVPYPYPAPTPRSAPASDDLARPGTTADTRTGTSTDAQRGAVTDAQAGTSADGPTAASADGPPQSPRTDKYLPEPPYEDVSLVVLAPLGRASAAGFRLLADLADRAGGGELRVTPWRSIVVPRVPSGQVATALAELRAAGLVTEPDSPWRGVSSCAGRPGCAKSLADVRGDAAATLRAADGASAGARRAAATPFDGTGVGAGHTALPVHWSGCERRCGRPTGDRVDVVAGPDGYRVTVVHGAGAAGDGTPEESPVSPAAPASLVSPGSPVPPVSPSDLAATVAAARVVAAAAGVRQTDE